MSRSELATLIQRTMAARNVSYRQACSILGRRAAVVRAARRARRRVMTAIEAQAQWQKERDA